MRDLPILFSAPMVRALLDGRKTQTRRVINPQPKLHPHHEPVRVEKRGERGWIWMVHTDRPTYQFATGDWKAPYAVGDRLYVRERGAISVSKLAFLPFVGNEASMERKSIAWPKSPDGTPYKPCPGIHMPRWASRITLIVTDVRVQRLQEISEADALAEGAVQPWTGSAGTACDDTRTPLSEFEALWDSLNADRGYGWDANPWVAAYTFRPILGNIDQVAR